MTADDPKVTGSLGISRRAKKILNLQLHRWMQDSAAFTLPQISLSFPVNKGAA